MIITRRPRQPRQQCRPSRRARLDWPSESARLRRCADTGRGSRSQRNHRVTRRPRSESLRRQQVWHLRRGAGALHGVAGVRAWPRPHRAAGCSGRCPAKSLADTLARTRPLHADRVSGATTAGGRSPSTMPARTATAARAAHADVAAKDSSTMSARMPAAVVPAPAPAPRTTRGLSGYLHRPARRINPEFRRKAGKTNHMSRVGRDGRARRAARGGAGGGRHGGEVRR